MIVGIVGSEQAKFTPETEAKARQIIRYLLSRPNVTGMASGHCHLGGVDIFAEEIADELGIEKFIFPPRSKGWSSGYRPRNIQIAKKCDECYCITLRDLPPGYEGMTFKLCYHCGSSSHVKSGGCWTVKEARRLGKIGKVLVIESPKDPSGQEANEGAQEVHVLHTP
jgi:hypothetical protein